MGEPLPARVLGRYALYGEIAAGGMASVHFGRLVGSAGFTRTVAIKRLHPTYSKDPAFVAMFMDEARLAGRIRHPNVVPTLDVVAREGELFLVMEYVQGESVARLMRLSGKAKRLIPKEIAVAVVVDVLHGLHAAHEAKSESGAPLGIVHRDVSPQNILVGIDGVSRVFDFGIAKAAGRTQTTKEGTVKGKLGYMPPEQIRGTVTRRTDVYACAVVLWEMLTGFRLYAGDNQAEILAKILHPERALDPPSTLVPRLPKELDDIVMKGLARDPNERFETARDMARALEQCVPLPRASTIGEWVESLAGASLAERASVIAEIETSSGINLPPTDDVATSDRIEEKRFDELRRSSPAFEGRRSEESATPDDRRRSSPSFEDKRRSVPALQEDLTGTATVALDNTTGTGARIPADARSGLLEPPVEKKSGSRRLLVVGSFLSLIVSAVALVLAYQGHQRGTDATPPAHTASDEPRLAMAPTLTVAATAVPSASASASASAAAPATRTPPPGKGLHWHPPPKPSASSSSGAKPIPTDNPVDKAGLDIRQ